MPRYIWQLPQWPNPEWDARQLLRPLADCRRRQGALLAKLAGIGLEDSLRAQAQSLEEDVVQTAAIEGERLDREQVRSSVAVHLGLNQGGLRPADRATDGLVMVLLDATQNHAQPLTAERLCGWQAALFPSGYSGLSRIVTGAWREKPMQVVSGPLERHQVHFEAPPPGRLDAEMESFLSWWEESQATLDGIVRAGLAHLRFVTIHPFDDGNGRLARTLTDMALAQDENLPARYYSLSAQIMHQRNSYYDVLERTQKGDGDATEWLLWFLERVDRAMAVAERTIAKVLLKAEFWRRHTATTLSERQRKVVNRLLDAGPEDLGGGFEGGLTNRKYLGMTKASRATAYRELADLVAKGILRPREGKGRGAAYDLVWPE
ncbi:filamentation induced by cAMP protein Fic [Desulfarculus baarsii DSM 2075]|uniref:Filamentation induced by cAMP protein Fic n=1 Tax=Desulfarculus baarsii (strain ATCC 33931 / DSM 2075 / LMG 7858 / VKM B-1802 / 2st14) TaxID=644282 RepID=E1QK58_DESB2|nr:Fic family protein [Desulfarculus baarsii]ADK85951.1 filamentation induced by cAMP protein Fic [Desulfarculus baarsii DSM 2075]